jgi:hypothetical protein
MLDAAFDRYIDLLGATDAFELIEPAFRRRQKSFASRCNDPPGGQCASCNRGPLSLSEQDISNRATELVGTLSAEQAYSVGTTVGSLLKDGMPIKTGAVVNFDGR